MPAANKKFPIAIFAFAFAVVAGVVFISRLLSPLKAEIFLPDNAGSSGLLTYGRTLVAVFQDGEVAAWDWNAPAKTLWRFSAGSDRVVLLDDIHIAGTAKTGRRYLFTADVKQGKILSETPVGWGDQEVWLIQSPDKKVLVLARISPDREGHTLYEFMTIDPAKGNPAPPVSIDAPTAEKRFLVFAVSNDKKFLAAGSVNERGFLIIADIEQRKVFLEREYEQAREFTSVAFTPDGSLAFLTSRDGSIYGVNAASGEVESTYTALKPGEKNPVTNDTSSQNITISADGRYVGAVVTNTVHIWQVKTGGHILRLNTGQRLTGAIALSSDGSLLATSDIRASGSIKIWKLRK